MKPFTLLKNFIWVIVAFTLQSCGTSLSQRSVDEKLAAEPMITSQTELIKKNDEVITSASGLTDSQKIELNTLRNSARIQSASLQQQALKLRQILIKELVASDYDSNNASAVRTIKQKLSNLEKERLNLTFDSIDKAQKILGHEAKNNQQIMINHFFDREIEGHGAY